MNTLLSESEVGYLVPKTLETVFLKIVKEKSLRFQETIIKESINELCKNDSFREAYIDFTLNCVSFKLNEVKQQQQKQIEIFPEGAPLNTSNEINLESYFPKLISRTHTEYDIVPGEHTNPNYPFTMPRSLFVVRKMYNLNPQFKLYVTSHIKPFLDMTSERFIYILKKTFPQVSDHWIDSSLVGALSKTKIALYGGTVTKCDYNWCRFLFNFKTLEILNKK